MDIKDLMILANNLRQERLLVNSEQEALQSLNEHVATNSLQVYQCSWIKCQQRINLNKLTIARSNYSPANCCQKANALATTKFVEAQKILRYQDVQAYSEFLQFLRCSPELVATCLTAGDRIAPEAIQRVCCSLITGLYGTCLLPEDMEYVLQVLKCLMEMQLMLSEDPRRMLRNGSCAFSRLYLIFHEGLFSAKLFLSAALKEPVLQLLMEEEAYLDMDPDIAATRNPPDEMLKKLGKDEHRKWTMNTLVNITNQFVMSLREHWVLFPNNVTWLVHQMVIMLRKQNFPNKKVKAMCTDLIFTHLICPAIVCPERCGVTEVQVSSVQQFNLMQIAQIVQMLALSQNHEVDPKFRELYGRFDKNCLSSLLDSLTEISDETVSITQEPSRDMPRLSRTSLMFTLQELNTFVSYFQLVVDQSSQQNNEGSNCLGSAYKSQLTRLLANLPVNCEIQKGVSPNLSNAVSPESPKKGLLGKASKTRLGRYGGSSAAGDGQSSSAEDCPPINNAASCSLLMSDDNRNIIEDVLMIPLPGGQVELLGLLPENEVLAMDPSNAIDLPNEVARQNPILPDLSLNQGDVQSRQTGGRTLNNGGGISNEKRTRFSLSHEEGSIGNTSDNIEVVSEAASNHSVASSLELENEDQNDNLSDMTSANVSGRGTPNISGRDTPSSQVTEGGAPELRPAPPNSNAQKSLKQSRSDIQDKFCKFEIKKLLEGDETVSIISDTWSTDVLASDSEAVESGYERNYPAPLLSGHNFASRLSMPPVPVLLERNNRIMIAPPSMDRLLDASETASESAWSTDVLASDSERMTEIDTDDCHSVARSDTDTARSEVDIDHAQDNPGGGGDNQQQVQNQPPQPAPRFPSPLSPIVNVSPIFAPQIVRRDVEQMPNDSSMLEGAVQLRTRNSSSSSASSNRPSGVNGIASILQNHHQAINNLPSHNSTMNSFDSGDGSVFHGSYHQNQQNKNDTPRSDTSSSGLSNQNPISLFNGNNTNTIITNNDMFHSMSSPFVSAMATRSNGFLLDSASFSNDNSGRNYAERKFSDDLVPDSSMLVNNLNSGVVFRPIQGSSASSIHQDVACEMNFNVTGRGGSLSDYRRRTMEYVDSNANNSSLIPHSPGSNEDILDHGESVTTNDIDFSVGTVVNNPSDRFSSVDLTNNSQDAGLATLVSRLNISVADSLFNDTGLHNRIEAVKTSEKRTVIEKREEDAEPIIDGVTCPVYDGTISIPSTSKSSTGAIPKSISFDSTADKYHRDYDASSSVRRGMGNMFNKLKQGFRSRRGKGRALDDSRGYEDYELARNCTRRGIQTREDEMGLERPAINNQGDRKTPKHTTEDILAKYRRKISTSSEAATSGTSDSTGSNSSSKHKNAHHIVDRHEKRLRNSVSAVEPSCSYEDAKHKLRFVLSTVDLQNTDFNRNCPQLESTLMSFLRMQLSESAALDDSPLSVQLHEAIRSIEAIGTPSEIELCRELQFDYEARALYIQYLVNTRKILLQTLAYLDRILTRISVERQVCDEHLVRVCVRMFLENREAQVNAFCDDFRALGLSDEKMDLLEGFLNELHGEMLRDQNWQAASEEQLLAASLSIERIVMGRVYFNALYPNGDGDIARDKVLHAHIERLSSVVTVTHKDLRIPPRHQRAAPWPHSQQLLRRMSAYRAARDKARCVARCVTSILHVLAMSQDGGCPAADDLVPVLVFILIKANPPALLSTVQYVNSFYGSSLQGAEHYWWIQFCSAIEFIKTMDEND